ncbi:hypothetical protein BDU57DRAFT_540570 [Ampelomyces quisqualis]|uniref:Uncharacterized protein n=1 Tax=Ampelomyces quisqualis TaxID=50730 RepID=A0A6A5QG14_AMPQU|nr:hypothetical protein BDU57DRAFT_540570 [Ampelomyces quisqualis]
MEFDLSDSGILDFTDLPIVIEAAGINGLKGFGLGNSGPWGNHAVKCVVEGVIYDKLHGNTGGLSNCVRIFEDRLKPYMAGPGRFVARVEKSAAPFSRRSTVGTNIRRTLETWGFLRKPRKRNERVDASWEEKGYIVYAVRLVNP